MRTILHTARVAFVVLVGVALSLSYVFGLLYLLCGASAPLDLCDALLFAYVTLITLSIVEARVRKFTRRVRHPGQPKRTWTIRWPVTSG